ncbi:MAG: tRNA (adenosine(37)-N6)-threonylcarbamoyltransferase complex transferase subunit TsaD, partial [Candidatus Methanomethylophilaceae archaeon]|nr:tRNA (adenosine(37)-N6)-threonylcarbamoyltransferase complex transferase subunit TsaD [Candidatus Methanomethylophilaceae archaeon]
MLILAVESSCDETSVAVVEMNDNPRVRRILSNRIASQIPLHAAFGGVVPEIASRAHAEAISSLAYEALEESGVSLSEIGAIGVTAYPGLIGALLVGVNFAKGLAMANGIPLVPVNHIHGHIAANYFSDPAPEPPFLALVVSGGHTSLSEVLTYTDIRVIGRTRDDAAGEAFDKVAKILGIPY